MERTELRLGNSVSTPIGEATVVILREVDLYISRPDESDHRFLYKDIKGIALTPEWLEKLGFKHGAVKHDFMWKHPNDGKKVKELFHFININHEKDAPFITVEMGNDHGHYCDQPIQHIKYVHQLQNLYFALTGKELAIDNKSL